MKQDFNWVIDFLSPYLSQLKNDYWFIGSSSLSLQGIAVDFADIDLLTSSEDAIGLMEQLKEYRVSYPLHTDNHRYRSQFARFLIAGYAVEVMGDLEINYNGEWVHVVNTITKTERITINHHVLPVPSLQDQLTIYKLLDREKDIHKIQGILDKMGVNA
jgi:hypothetical protein